MSAGRVMWIEKSPMMHPLKGYPPYTRLYACDAAPTETCSQVHVFTPAELREFALSEREAILKWAEEWCAKNYGDGGMGLNLQTPSADLLEALKREFGNEK